MCICSIIIFLSFFFINISSFYFFQVLADFEAHDGSSELSVKQNEIIAFFNGLSNQDWLFCKKMDGYADFVPRNFIRFLDAEQAQPIIDELSSSIEHSENETQTVNAEAIDQLLFIIAVCFYVLFFYSLLHFILYYFTIIFLQHPSFFFIFIFFYVSTLTERRQCNFLCSVVCLFVTVD